MSANNWLIWQLVDSAFPTGGFAHSAGLEAAWQQGEVRNRDELASFLDANLHQLGRGAVPFVTTTFDQPGRLTEIDQFCHVFTSNHVANRASRLQGQALWSAVERTFGRVLSEPRDNGHPAAAEPPHKHLAPLFGRIMSSLHVPRTTTIRMFLFNQLRAVLAAAVRLNIVGPMEAQAMQHRCSSLAEELACRCESLTLEDLAQTSPLLDLWQGTQDRLYSRLFQS